MPAYLIAQFVVKEPEKMAEYGRLATPLVQQFGGKVLFRAPVKKVLLGGSRASVAVVIEFDSIATMERMLASEAYRRIIPVRDAAGDGTFLAVEVP